MTPTIRGTHRERIFAVIRATPGLTDREIGEHTGIRSHQTVNQTCRQLAAEGAIARERGPHGRIVNRSTGAALQSMQSTARALSRHIPDDSLLATLPTPSDLEKTLILIACSGRKEGGGQPNTGSRAHALQVPAELLATRRRISTEAELDERALLPAWKRYDGPFYQEARRALTEILSGSGHLLILSGAYGVVRAHEQIGTYKLELKGRNWRRGLIEETLASYASSNGLTKVVAFQSRTTHYPTVTRRTGWASAGVESALLMSPITTSGSGAMSTVPRALGEAFEAWWRGQLQQGWRSSAGLSLSAETLVRPAADAPSYATA